LLSPLVLPAVWALDGLFNIVKEFGPISTMWSSTASTDREYNVNPLPEALGT